MRRTMFAGLAYFAVVFAVGFALGVLRGLLVAPLVGEVGAVVIELPVILGVSWWACGWVVCTLTVPASAYHRSLMSGVAFGLLLLAELAVSVLLMERTFTEHLATFARLPNQLGLLGQVVFALLPLVRRRTTR